jgi:hypothetical protein
MEKKDNRARFEAINEVSMPALINSNRTNGEDRIERADFVSSFAPQIVEGNVAKREKGINLLIELRE